MVEIKVDLNRREKLRRLHTATHIVNFSAREVLGNHVWQNGSNLKPEFGTLDITHYDNLTSEEIFKIEKLANRVIFEDRKVDIEELERTDAEKKYGFSVYQGGAIPMKKIRIIKVFDNDIEACGGTHMQSTGGIGLVKIVSAQKIQDGIIRLKFVVNEFALDYVIEKQKILDEVEETFSVDSSSVVRTSKKFFGEWKEQKKEIEKLKNSMKNIYINSSEKLNKLEIKEDYDMGFLMDLFAEIIKTKKSFELNSPKFLIATKDFKVKDNFKKEIKKGEFSIYIK